MNHNIIVIDNEKYMAVLDTSILGCVGCAFEHANRLCVSSNCDAFGREDNTEVIWKPYIGKRT